MNVIPSGFRNYFNLHLYDIPGAGIKQEFLSKKKNKPDFYVSQTEVSCLSFIKYKNQL